jgi:hypothetical protein
LTVDRGLRAFTPSAPAPQFRGPISRYGPATADRRLLRAFRLTEESCLPEFVSPARTHGLVDILDRVLDKGLVVAGDIKINLANVELLTIQIRLLVCSIDKAEQIGLNWWRADPRLALNATSALPVTELESRLERIERQLERLGGATGETPRSRGKSRGGT